MVEDLKTIYTGKATIIKNKQYLSAKEYIEPFVQRFQNITDKFICFVKSADQVSCDAKTIDIVYNRVLIYAIFPEKYDLKINSDIYHRVVCMAYNLDIKNPTCKFYTGVVDSKFNFYAFGSNCISIQKIEPEEALNYTDVKKIIETGSNDQCETMLKQLQDVSLSKINILNILGEWIDFTIKKEYINDSGKTKLSASMAIEAYKNLVLEKNSTYYSNEESIPMLNALRVWIEQVEKDDKDLNSRYEKTQLINQLLKL